MKIVGKTAAEIFASVRALVQSKQLQAGQALPPVRELAAALGVNRNTVAAAYKRLDATGIAQTLGRLGTLVRAPAQAGEQEGALADAPLIDLASGNPNPRWLPDPASVLANLTPRTRLYGASSIDPELERQARLWCADQGSVPYEIDLAHGAVDAIERLLAAHMVGADKIAVENPCFISSINTLRIAGMQVAGVEVDGAGMRPEALEQALAQGAKAVLYTPRAHNPTGCSLTPARARALSRVLQRYPQVLVIADDHFSLLSSSPYLSIIPPSTQHWALLRSASKCFGPDLRLAVIASDPETSQRLRLRLAPGTTWVSYLLQDLVSGFLASPQVAELLALARTDYARRRTMLANALRRHGIIAQEPADGLNLWVPLQQNSQDIVLRLARQGWLVRGGEAFATQNSRQAIRITISTLEENQAERLAADLRRCRGPA